MTKEQVLAEFHEELTDDAINQLNNNEGSKDSDNFSYVRIPYTDDLFDRPNTSFGILGGLEVTPHRGENAYNVNTPIITVYEVE